MQVKAKVNILYKGEVYERGEIFEADDVSAQVMAQRGTVEILGGGAVEEIEEEFEPAAEGLPDLITEKSKKKK